MNTKTLIVALMALLIGVGGGYAIGQSASTGDTSSEMVMEADDSSNDDVHDHAAMAKYEVKEAEAPSVELIVKEDAKSGWNVELMTKNFTFTPGNVNGDNVVGEGHAHLYVDDVKIARLYGPNFHYDGKFDGTKEFRVTLNANDHSEYAVDGTVLGATLNVTHDAHSDDSMESDGHSH